MGISPSSLREYLKSDEPKLGGFIYSRELDPNVELDLIEPDKISVILADAKTNRHSSPKRLARNLSSNTQKMGVKITDTLSHNMDAFFFPSKKAYRFTIENYHDRIINTFQLCKSKPGRSSFEHKGWIVEYL